jgi:hypothetical protein
MQTAIHHGSKKFTTEAQRLTEKMARGELAKVAVYD